MISRNVLGNCPNILINKNTRFTDENRAILEMKWLDEKVIATKLINKSLPDDCTNEVYIRYVKKWHSNAYNGRYTAIKWLRDEIAKLTSALQFFPVPLHRLRTIRQRKEQAKICADMCQSILVDCTEPVNIGLFPTEAKMLEYANLWHFTPTPPTATLIHEEGESDETFKARKNQLLAMGRIERLRTNKWWEAKIERSYFQFCEHCRIISGRVRYGKSKYVSDKALKDFVTKKRAGERYIDQMVARNDETGEEVPMRDIVAGSLANPQNKRDEFMARIEGFEEIADQNKLIAGFFTLTSPSKYHGFNSVKKGGKRTSFSNDKYQGFNPSQTQRYFCKVWQRARAKLKRLDLPLMGFRVAEPHHDATPHWHMFLFFSPDHETEILEVLKEYFLAEDNDELEKDISPRFKYERRDAKKGTAASYIAKYIAKNIDGYKLDAKGQNDALSVCAWASLWGIRQFQQLGGAPIGVWRELRRLPSTNKEGDKAKLTIELFNQLKEEKHPLELARYCADVGKWHMYLLAMGGIFCPRSLMPVSLTYKQIVNGYGETTKKTNGVESFGLEKVTREGNWSIVKATKHLAEDGSCERQFAPWSSVNNCTVDKNSAVEQAVIDQFNQLGVELDPMLLGPIIDEARILTGDGRRAWLSDTDLGMQLRVEEIFSHNENIDR